MPIYPTLQIEIPNFQKWQTETAKQRQWIALARNIWSDPKVLEAQLICSDALICFIWLLTQVDKSGKLQIRTSALKQGLMTATGSRSNFFHWEKRIEALSTASLLTVYHESTGTLPASYTSVELPQSQSEQDLVNNTQNEYANNIKKAPPQNRMNEPDFFLPLPSIEVMTGEERKAFEYIQTHASHDPNFQNLSWVPGFLKITFSEAPQKYAALKPEHILHCWRQACDVTFERSKGPSYLKSAFQGKLREFKPEQLSAHTRQNMSETDFPEYPKDRRGQYTSDLGNNIFPGNDFRVPFEQLDLNSKKHRVVARGFIQDGQFDLEQLHHPELSGFLREYCEKFPAIAVTEPFKTAYERLKANDAV